jgi:hypothetical protein
VPETAADVTVVEWPDWYTACMFGEQTGMPLLD